jgi:uncharacterized protein YbjT (DUF2867 family)
MSSGEPVLLVTGITGHSGRYFLQELVRTGYAGNIRCIVRSSSNTAALDESGLNVESLVGDLNDTQFLARAMVGVDTLLHIAGIHYSVNVIHAAVEANVTRAILVHTTGIYSKHKSAAEEYVDIERAVSSATANAPIAVVYLRPTMIYGYANDRNMAVFIRLVDRLRFVPVVAHGASLLQPVHGSDLGRAYYAVLMHPDLPRGDYVLSGDQPISMLEMFRSISENLGKRTTFISVPLGLGVFLARCLRVLTSGGLDFVERVQRMGEDRSFPHEDAREAFGYDPMKFSAGLSEEIAEYRRLRRRGPRVPAGR